MRIVRLTRASATGAMLVMLSPAMAQFAPAAGNPFAAITAPMAMAGDFNRTG